MMRSQTTLRLAAAAGALLLAGCSFTPAVETTRTESALPDTFAAASVVPEPPDVSAWWQEFDDPALNEVVDAALLGNFDLEAAVARLDEARATYRIARAPLVPSVAGSAGFTRSSTPANTGFSGDLGESIPGFPSRFENDTYSISGTLSYEVDLWGRVRTQKNAALNAYFATAEDVRAVQTAIIAEAVTTYLGVRAIEEQLALATRNVELLQERVELTQDRYRRGLVTSFELYQIRQEYESTRTGIPLLESSLAGAEARLAVVTGMLPQEARVLIGASGSIPRTAIAPIPAGLPSTLLTARPDVAAAVYRVDAAAESVGTARAQLLPALSLTGTGGLQSADLSDLLDPGQTFSNLVASLAGPLFQGGALRANVAASNARLEQAVSAFEKTLLTAFTEVGATLTAFEKQQERLGFLEDELRFAGNSLQTAEDRYRRGVGDYLALVDAKRNLIRVEIALVASRQDLANARLAVYRALGGYWTETDAS